MATLYDDPEPEPEELLEAFPPSEGGPALRKVQTESAIEAKMRHALLTSRYFEPVQVSSPILLGYGPVGMLLQELPVLGGRYRLDFAIVDPVSGTYIAIECDGHEWHERTKEQAARDKARDRALTADGWKVLRFTGSEVWADPDACVDEVAAMLLPEMRRQVAK